MLSSPFASQLKPLTTLFDARLHYRLWALARANLSPNHNYLLTIMDGDDSAPPLTPPETPDPNPDAATTNIDDSDDLTHDRRLGPLSSQKITPLNDDNWMAWKLRITELMKVWNVFGHATDEDKRPSENSPNEFKKWSQRERIATILIQNNIESEQMVHVSNCLSVAEMWKSLKQVYETHSIQTAVELKRKLATMKASYNTDVRKYLTDMKKTRMRLEMMGRSVDDEDFKLTVVSSLPRSWDYWTTAYLAGEESKVTRLRMNSQQLISIICDEAKQHSSTKRKHNDNDEEDNKDRKQETAYHVLGHTRDKKPRMGYAACKICNRTNHKTRDCRHKGKPKCGYCGRLGHYTDDCWGRKKEKDRDRDKDRDKGKPL